MPRIHRNFLDCVFFLYKSVPDAVEGKNAGGTGFLVATPTEDGLGHHYGVTNWHVAVKGGYSVIRLNLVGGGVDVLDLDPSEWEYESGGDDIAITPLDIRGGRHFCHFLGTQIFLTEPQSLTEAIGPGDDVFMMGRFIDIDTPNVNTPALRFGNISTFPIPIKQSTNFEGVSYCIDMHSRSGYSGSPVFVYRTPGNDLRWAVTGQADFSLQSSMLLLGIHWGQFPEELAIGKRKRKVFESVSAFDEVEYVEGLSGMTCVIPAWKIQTLLNSTKFIEQRKLVENARIS